MRNHREEYMSRKIKYDYDCSNDSLFLYGKDRYDYDFSEELDNGIIIDFDKNQNPVAFEIFNASKKFKINKNVFNVLSSIKVKITITEKAIDLSIILFFKEHNKPMETTINYIMDNFDCLPEIEGVFI